MGGVSGLAHESLGVMGVYTDFRDVFIDGSPNSRYYLEKGPSYEGMQRAADEAFEEIEAIFVREVKKNGSKN